MAGGEEAVQRIKDRVRQTFRREVIGDIGGFGGLFALDRDRYKHPVLVSSSDQGDILSSFLDWSESRRTRHVVRT